MSGVEGWLVSGEWGVAGELGVEGWLVSWGWRGGL